MYVIRRIEDGAYVSRSGSTSSYTHVLENAQKFKTWEVANANRCPDNEKVVNIYDIPGMQT